MLALTPKQRRAADAHIAGANYTDSYRAAYDCSRMAPSTVNRRAFDLFHRPHVSAYVDAAHSRATRGAVLTREGAIAILERIATSRPAALLDERGEVDIERLRQMGQEVSEITSLGNGRVKVKLNSQLAALERLAKMLGWDEPERHQHAVSWQLDLGTASAKGQQGQQGQPQDAQPQQTAVRRQEERQ